MNSPVGVSGSKITRAAIFAEARALPASPQILAGLCELLQDLNTDLQRIAAEISLEPALAARVIRMSNSAVVGGGQRLGSVNEAVNRVGFGEVLRLVGAATVTGLVDRSLGGYGIALKELRESLLLHALASEVLAERAGIDARRAYAAGLLRGVGMMVLDRLGRPTMVSSDGYDPARYADYAEWERARFGIEGVEATAAILDDWNFPAEVVGAVRDHLLRGESGCQDRLTCVLNLAGGIVAGGGRALPGEAACWTVTPAKLVGAGLSEAQFQSATSQAIAEFERQRNGLY